jgi:hypothetical protein
VVMVMYGFMCLFLDEFEAAINSCSGNSWYGVLALHVEGG